MHPFHSYINNYTPLSSTDWEKIKACLVRREIAKGELILEAGRVCRHLWFLESGYLRYFVWKDGVDVSKFFTSPPYCFTSQRSFTTFTPADESIEALEESVIWQMSEENANRLLDIPAWSTFVRKLVQEVQYYTELILQDLQNHTAEDRYRIMLEESNPLLQHVPLKHLATYLGIAPQSLSRIRKKVVSQGS